MWFYWITSSHSIFNLYIHYIFNNYYFQNKYLYSKKKNHCYFKIKVLFLFQGTYGIENNLSDVFFLTSKQYTTLENKNERYFQPRDSIYSSGTKSRSKHSLASLTAVRIALSHTGRVEGNRIVKPLHKRTDKRIRKKYMSKPHVTFNKELQQFIRSYSVAWFV